MDIVADERISGSTLERPGLQAALRMIKRADIVSGTDALQAVATWLPSTP